MQTIIGENISKYIVRYGTEYGGFNVYSRPMKARKNAIVYSFGIGEDLSFSEALWDELSPNISIYAFDPTPRAIKYVEGHWLHDDVNFHFFPFGLAAMDGKMVFHLPKNEQYVSGSLVLWRGVKDAGIEVEMKCFDTILKELGHTHIDLLKMDIEGTEFDVIEQMSPHSARVIDQILLEAHNRFFEDGRKLLENMHKKLQSLDYILVFNEKNSLTYVRAELLRMEEGRNG